MYKCESCGAENNDDVRFCTVCGKALKCECEISEEKVCTEKSDGKKPTLVVFYRALKIVPSAALALFSVLLFLIYLGSIGSMFGGDVCNVYEAYNGYLGNDSTVLSIMSALIVFAVFALLFSAVALTFALLPSMKGRKVSFGKLRVKLGDCFAMACLAFYLIFLILSIAMIVYFSEFSAGVCPILVIVFAIVFAAVSAAAFIARKLMKGNAVIAEFIGGMKQCEDNEYSALSAPVEPVAPTEEQVQACNRYKKLAACVKLKRAVICCAIIMYMCLALVPSIVVMLTAVIGGKINDLQDLDKILGYGIYDWVILAAFLIAIIVIMKKRSKKIELNGLHKIGGILVFTVITLLPVIISVVAFFMQGEIIRKEEYLKDIYYMSNGTGEGFYHVNQFFMSISYNYKYYSYSSSYTSYSFEVYLYPVTVVATLVLGISTIVCRVKIRDILYGKQSGIKKSDAILIDDNALNALYESYCVCMDYAKKMRIYGYERALYDGGNNYIKKPPKGILWFDMHKIKSTVIAVVIALAVIIIGFMPAF